MELIFDIASSIEFWRQRYPLDRKPQHPEVLAPKTSARRTADIRALLPAWASSEEFLAPTGGTLHVLVLDDTVTRSSHGICKHRWSTPLPEGSLYRLSSNVYIESPEFMFLHAASILEFSQLIAFGDELCGHYSFDRREKRGFRTRSQPLTSKDSLGQFLELASPTWSITPPRRWRHSTRCSSACPATMVAIASPSRS